MYPFVRFAKELVLSSRLPPLELGGTHVSRHVIWPQDLDFWVELNNGRIMTLFDLGRTSLFVRMGLIGVMRERSWAGTVAGSSVRYRKRMRLLDRVEMRSRIVTWDARFTYAEQSLWKGEDCTAHALLRLAITDGSGLVPSEALARELGLGPPPPMPGWIAAWAEADARRPWPP